MLKLMAIVAVIVCAACNRPALARNDGAPALELARGRRALESLVKSADVLEPNRRVVHLAHVCSLSLSGNYYPVVDLQELVRGVATPRGVNSILIFGPDGKPRRRVEYTTERPLFCAENRLYVWGDLTVEGIKGEGNELEVSDDGRGLVLQHVEANDLPL